MLAEATKRRVLIVDDSFIMRKLIREIIESDDLLDVADVAENGQIALQKVREIKPDLVPVIQALWALNLPTLMCCQDVGEAMATPGSKCTCPQHKRCWSGSATPSSPLGWPPRPTRLPITRMAGRRRARRLHR